MIPTIHGKPEAGLVPWARLWRTQSGKGWCGGIGEGWLLHVWPEGEDEGEYRLLLGRQEKESERPRLLTPLVTAWDEARGRVCLLGRHGLSTVAVYRNEGGGKALGDAAAYLSIKPPVWRSTARSFT